MRRMGVDKTRDEYGLEGCGGEEGVAGTIKRGCWGAWAMGGVCVAAINQEKEWNASLEITLLHIFSSCEVPGVHVLEILICT